MRPAHAREVFLMLWRPESGRRVQFMESLHDDCPVLPSALNY